MKQWLRKCLEDWMRVVLSLSMFMKNFQDLKGEKGWVLGQCYNCCLIFWENILNPPKCLMNLYFQLMTLMSSIWSNGNCIKNILLLRVCLLILRKTWRKSRLTIRCAWCLMIKIQGDFTLRWFIKRLPCICRKKIKPCLIRKKNKLLI